jgi:hypothetical protein
MKKLIAIAAVATLSAMSGMASADLKIDGTNVQTVMSEFGTIHNLAKGDKANKNVSSNVGDVHVASSGTNFSTTYVGASYVGNIATGGVALQNVSSNQGKVKITGYNDQLTSLLFSTVLNEAKGDNATQNVASNAECQGCK